jgi:hypothetical protein
MALDKESMDRLNGSTRSVYYDGDGKFVASSEGRGCCSDTYYDLTKEQAINLAGSMIEHWMQKRMELQAVSKAQMREDVLKNANL